MRIKNINMKKDNKKVRTLKLRDFCGIWSKEEADQFEKGIEKIRKLREKGNSKRIEMLKKYKV